ncbi:MAG: SPOR domain-containing protein [Magnetococcales bacterium]|nr:SPOR domain-containing protein [Magnetococcales bacterium]
MTASTGASPISGSAQSPVSATTSDEAASRATAAAVEGNAGAAVSGGVAQEKPARKKGVVPEKAAVAGDAAGKIGTESPPAAKAGGSLSVQGAGGGEEAGIYAVQVAAFLDEAAATAFVARLREKGYDAYVKPVRGRKDPSRIWMSAKIGRFTDPAEAKALEERYERSEKGDVYVTRLDSFAPWHAPSDDWVAPEAASPVVPVVSAKGAAGAVTGEDSGDPSTISPSASRSSAPVRKATSAPAKKEAPVPVSVSTPSASATSSASATPSASVTPPASATPSVSAASAMASAIPGVAPMGGGKYPQVTKGAPAMVSGTRQVERLLAEAAEARGMGDPERAIALLTDAHQYLPTDTVISRNLGGMLAEENRDSEALAILERSAAGRSVASLVADDPQFTALLAALLQRRGDHWRTIDLYEALLVKHPHRGLWRMGMAISLEQVGEKAAAREAYQRSLNSGQLSRKLKNFVERRIQAL